MAVRDIFKINRKTFFNPSGWIDYPSLKGNTKMLYGILKTTFTVPTSIASETFEESVKRQGLTEKDIADGIGSYRALALVFVILALAAIAYAAYLMYYHATFTGLMLSLVVSALCFSQAFKYDFWAMQMSKRKLGLTFVDWKRQYLGD